MNRPEELKQREGKEKRKEKSPIKPLPTPGPSHLPSLRGPPVRPQFACDDPAASPMPGSSRAGRVTRTRHLGELSSRSSKTPRIAKMATPVCKAQTPCMSCQNLEAVRCGSCLPLASAHCLLALLPQGEARDVFQRALTAFLFCLYVVLLYLMSCLVFGVCQLHPGLPIAILPTCKPSRPNRKLSIHTCTSSIIMSTGKLPSRWTKRPATS